MPTAGLVTDIAEPSGRVSHHLSWHERFSQRGVVPCPLKTAGFKDNNLFRSLVIVLVTTELLELKERAYESATGTSVFPMDRGTLHLEPAPGVSDILPWAWQMK